MFKIDYVFQRGGPEYHCTLPSEKDRNHNIFVARGRNDQGKSTLLQMIALGLCGEEAEDIDRSLKDKMLRLVAADTEECEIDFTIGTDNDPNILRVTIHERKIDRALNGDRIGLTAMNDHFKIIYDVPDDPVRKLQSATSLVEQTFGYYTKYLKDYGEQITQIKNDFNSYQKRQERLASIYSQKEVNSKKKQLIESRKEKLKDEMTGLRKSYVVTSYTRLYKDLEKLQRKQKVYEKRIKELQDRGAGKPNAAYKKQLAEFDDRLASFKAAVSYMQRFSDTLAEQKSQQLSKVASGIESAYSPKQISDGQIKSWHDFFDGVHFTLMEHPLYKAAPAELSQIKLFEQLLEILKHFISLEVAIPATNGKNVGEFVTELESAKRSIKQKTAESLAISEAADACSEVLARLSELAVKKSILPSKDYKDDDEWQQLTKEVRDLKDNARLTDNELRELEKEFMAIPPEDYQKYLAFGRNVEQEYDNAQRELDGLEKESEEVAVTVNTLERYEKELKAIEPPPEINISEIDALDRIVQRIKWKIPAWERALSAIDITNLDKKLSLDDESQPFYEALGDYFADILGVVYFEDKQWKVNRVDFTQRAYVVEGRSPINFNDIGMGHTALNSLLTRLKQDFGERQKIVLFDEIGIMDEHNVARLLNEIKERVKTGDVLLALLTQVDNTLDKMVLEPIAVD